MVFDVAAAPTTSQDEFLAWFGAQTAWSEEHSYNDPRVTTPELQAWFWKMIEYFPPMNGPHADDNNVDDPRVTDYSIGRAVIYAAFAWSEAEAAGEWAVSVASQTGVGFYRVSEDPGYVWAPDGKGNYLPTTGWLPNL